MSDAERLIAELVTICSRHVYSGSADVVVPEPYAPFVPSEWNRTLIVAESQNLAGASPYLTRVVASSPDERIRRLYWEPSIGLGIGPWDDGTIKLAAAAVWPDSPATTYALSNAVLWSQRSAEGRNMNPEEALWGPSRAAWMDLLMALVPERIVTIGAIAARVMEGLSAVPMVRWASASPQLLSRMAVMFDEADLLGRFPEVKVALDRHPEWAEKYHRNKVFYACHAVSTTRGSIRRSGRPA